MLQRNVDLNDRNETEQKECYSNAPISNDDVAVSIATSNERNMDFSLSKNGNAKESEANSCCYEDVMTTTPTAVPTIYENRFDAENNEDKSVTTLSPSSPKNCIIDIENETNKPINNADNSKDLNEDKRQSKGQYDSVSLTEPCCRVCQCSGEEESLISPCHCSGSVKWVHESCLVHWMKTSFKDSCELCLRKIEIAKRIKPLSKWTLPSRRPTPVVWVLVFVTAIALNLASIVKDASRLCSTTPCLVFYAVGCMGIILGSLFLIFWTKRARSFFNHWLEQNEEWVVILEKKTEQDNYQQSNNDKNSGDPKV